MQAMDWDRIAEDYYSEILSPIQDSINNPLLEDLKRLKGKRVIDLGCGIGPLLPMLSKHFSTVTALDYSQSMLDKARDENTNLKNVNYLAMSMKEIDFIECYDTALSVNSLLDPDPENVRQIISNIYDLLQHGGKFIGIVPAMEVYLYQAMLIMQRSGKDAAEEFLSGEHDLLSGTITFDGDCQKCFYRFELRHLLEQAGFSSIQVSKVLYPWEEFRKAGQEYFPEAGNPWDWYFRCEKTN